MPNNVEQCRLMSATVDISRRQSRFASVGVSQRLPFLPFLLLKSFKFRDISLLIEHVIRGGLKYVQDALRTIEFILTSNTNHNPNPDPNPRPNLKS